MAVIRDGIVISPSVDTIDDATFFDSTTIEPGIYTLIASKTIDSLTASTWSVICLSTEDATGPLCYTQLWMPSSLSGLSVAQQKVFIRSVNNNGTGFGDFTTLVNKDYVASNTLVNKTSYPTELYIQNNRPSAVSGKTIVWIDTSS
jgi:hypothetical protein